MSDQSPITATGSTVTEADNRYSPAFMYQVLSGRLASQIDRVDKIDAKIGAVAAAIIAAIGFSFPDAHSGLDRILAASLALPLLLILIAFGAFSWDDAPQPEAFRKKYPEKPSKTLEAVMSYMVTAYGKNRNKLVWKARLTNASLILIAILVVVIAVAKIVEPQPQKKTGSGLSCCVSGMALALRQHPTSVPGYVDPSILSAAPAFPAEPSLASAED